MFAIKKITAGKFAVLFWILTATIITSIAAHLTSLHFFIKPLLIPSLAGWLYLGKKDSKQKNLLLTGLFFSFLGDVLLLFESRYPVTFIFGLAAFLITHICYIVFFLKHQPLETSFLKKWPVTGLLVIAYGIGLVWLLFPHLGPLKLPVIIYAITICTMLLCSLHIFLQLHAPSNMLYVMGALLFVLSDSILAVDKFHEHIVGGNILIMLTYCTAQYLIVRGFIAEKAYMQ